MHPLFGPIAISIWMAMVLLAAVLARRRWPEQRETSRKIVHIGTGAVIPLAWVFQVPWLVAVPFAAMVTAITAINHQWRIIPAVEDVDRSSFGTVAYGLAITILLLLFWPIRTDAVTAGVLVMAFGDGLAGLIGRSLKSAQWSVLGQTKSMAGTLTMALVSALVLIGLSTISATSVPWGAVIGLSLLATGLEQLSPLGIDNLTVPLVVGLLWATLI